MTKEQEAVEKELREKVKVAESKAQLWADSVIEWQAKVEDLTARLAAAERASSSWYAQYQAWMKRAMEAEAREAEYHK